MIHPLLDGLVGLLTLGVSYVVAVHPFRHRQDLSDHVRRLAPLAWLARVGGAFFTYYFYLLYYGGGDVINYIHDSLQLVQSFILKPGPTIDYLLFSLTRRDYRTYFDINPEYFHFIAENNLYLGYTHDFASQTVGVLTFPFSLLTLGSVNGTIALFSTFSFHASFKFFLSLQKVYPRSWERAAIPVLFLPSVISWIALPFKEAYALLFILNGIRKIIIEPASLLSRIAAFILLYFAYVVKPYVIISMIPLFGFMLLQSIGTKAKRDFYLYSLYILVGPMILGLSFYLLVLAAESSGKYSFEKVAHQAYLVQTDLTRNVLYYTETGGSVYDIGEFEPTIEGMLSKFPIAFYTGLFRPFLWEAKKGVILLAAIETTFLLGYVAYGLLTYGIMRVLRSIVSHKWSLLLMIFAVFFIFMMGLTSGNFGNLVRYRVPGIFFFYLVIFAAYGQLSAEATHSRRGQ
ncbi:MAG: hypothetical protein N2253_08705 [Bacteroidia bacterium]|nr:hypothetical protein [Bacteroidia bacterium]MCX7764952.1 hypothetical protein [Bacteroidia bacterium]MDW8057115.1 hypothetical protein [Bacteroidia bacterium]